MRLKYNGYRLKYLDEEREKLDRRLQRTLNNKFYREILRFHAEQPDRDTEVSDKSVETGTMDEVDQPTEPQSSENEKPSPMDRRFDLDNPKTDDPETLKRVAQMKEQIQALFPMKRKVHPRHKTCPICRKHFYSRPALISHLKTKWK